MNQMLLIQKEVRSVVKNLTGYQSFKLSYHIADHETLPHLSICVSVRLGTYSSVFYTTKQVLDDALQEIINWHSGLPISEFLNYKQVEA